LKITVFSTQAYDRKYLTQALEAQQSKSPQSNARQTHTLHFLDTHLNAQTAILAQGSEGVCAFVNDTLDRETLTILANLGVKTIALRSAGYNHVDLIAAKELKLVITRVPAYSPYAVAEHTIALILSLNRQIPRAYNRVREGNFSLQGLLGFDIHGLTVGIIGTGKIGLCVARILKGFGCKILTYDPQISDEAKALGCEAVSLETLLSHSDIITLHCPLTPDTHHLINQHNLQKMKKGVMLINTSRGGLVDTYAVIDGLKSGHVGYLGLDVYEEESDLFFEDLSGSVIQDDCFARLLTFPNVLITGHQAFFTKNALIAIAETTIQNLDDFARGHSCKNKVD
jgi:D-lactate dehydrogenase